VDAQVAGKVLDLSGQCQHIGRKGGPSPTPGRVLRHVAKATPAVELLGVGVLLAGAVAEGPGHVAHRGAGPVGDDVAHLGRVVATVRLVDVLDHLLTPVALDVDVDVGRPVALG